MTQMIENLHRHQTRITEVSHGLQLTILPPCPGTEQHFQSSLQKIGRVEAGLFPQFSAKYFKPQGLQHVFSAYFCATILFIY